MKIINSISGGPTSSYIAANYKADYNIFSLVCINHEQSRLKDPSMIKYVNEKLNNYQSLYGEFIATAEDDLTLYAMRDLEQFIGKEIIWVRGKNFDDVLKSANTHGGCPTRLPSKMLRYCTDEMKMVPIFKWWLLNIGEKVKMRIGFRADEFARMERFFNGNPNHFKFPTYSKNYGQKLQHHENFNWRYCSFDLVKEGITKPIVNDFWKGKIAFPAITNCVGCPFKQEETLAVMAEINNSKMEWFSDQELLGKGTWQNNGKTYREIMDNRFEIAKEAMYEIIQLGQSCDSGGCTN